MVELVGWISSVVLLATLIKQVHKQWQQGSSENISRWLFIGQLAASVGFLVYSVLTGSWIFTVTNAMLTVNNIVGLCFYFYFPKSGDR